MNLFSQRWNWYPEAFQFSFGDMHQTCATMSAALDFLCDLPERMEQIVSAKIPQDDHSKDMLVQNTLITLPKMWAK
ncbi:MAG: hypothetical protein V9H69_22895 [Anaerolineae bacterium]